MFGPAGEDDEEDFPFVGIPIPGPDGPYVARAADGTVLIQGQYKGGQPHGEWRGSYEDGSKKVRGRFGAGGLQEGEWTTWWPTGRRREVGSYKGGLAIGLWQLWYPNGELFETMEHADGEAHGPWNIHWDNGQVADAMMFERGRQIGLETDHDRAGRAVAQGAFTDHRPSGTWRCFEANGAVRELPAPPHRITPREACGYGAPPDLPEESPPSAP